MSLALSHSVPAAPILQDCCARSVACRLHLLHSGQFADARFHLCNDDRLVVHVAPCDLDDTLQIDALCCVAFPFNTSLYAFLDCIKNVRDGSVAVEILFARPTVLTATNLRKSFRVPVIRADEVHVEMRLPDGTRMAAIPVNVSESGIEIELGPDDTRLQVDTEVQFSLRFRDDTVYIPAIVQRRQQSRRALKFQPNFLPDSRQRIAMLNRVIRALEQVWLKSRRDS